MIKIKLADSIIKSHLVDSKGNSYCSIPISVDKKLNVEGLFDKLVAIDPKLKSYDQSTSPYNTIFVNVPIDMELEAKEAIPKLEKIHMKSCGAYLRILF